MSVEKVKGGKWRIRVYLGVKNNKKDWHKEIFHGTEAEANAR